MRSDCACVGTIWSRSRLPWAWLGAAATSRARVALHNLIPRVILIIQGRSADGDMCSNIFNKIYERGPRGRVRTHRVSDCGHARCGAERHTERTLVGAGVAGRARSLAPLRASVRVAPARGLTVPDALHAGRTTPHVRRATAGLVGLAALQGLGQSLFLDNRRLDSSGRFLRLCHRGGSAALGEPSRCPFCIGSATRSTSPSCSPWQRQTTAASSAMHSGAARSHICAA